MDNGFVYIETYGCSANQNNSEILKGILKSGGYEITNNEKIADIIIINSCIVKGKTENKIKRRIQDLKKLYRSKTFVVTGCMPETNSEDIKKLNRDTLLLGTHHLKDILNLLKDFKDNRLTEEKQKEYLSFKYEEKILINKIPQNKLISITQISEGCLGNCSFCKVKLAKGRLFSYNPDRILKSIKNDLDNGAKEVWLTSQDCASYYLDKEGNQRKFPELLKKILSINKKFKLRIGMMNPNNLYPILKEIIEIYKDPKVYKFLHIPIQSASNKILKEMNRPYKIELVEEIINEFKKEIPNLTLSTDIIVGYPSETAEDHQLNLLFIKKFKPDVFNLSKFSKHKELKNNLNPLDKDIISKRTSELMEIHRENAYKNKEKFLNKKIEVFVNSKSKIPCVFESRDENYNIVLVESKDKSLLGKFINVKIKNIGAHHMIGEII